jgi:DNA-binding NtrC family response regulator
MPERARILLVEDDADLADALEGLLDSEYLVETAPSGEEGLRKALTGDFDSVITDLHLPDGSGFDVVARLHQTKPQLPVILMTADHTAQHTIKATKLGAVDYFPKPGRPEDYRDLLTLLQKTIQRHRRAAEGTTVTPKAGADEIIVGRSRVMVQVYKEIGLVAANPVDVLIRGETGTGKELVARFIHEHSDRGGRELVTVNCANLSENLLESELFGHEAGAFTGARGQRLGRFEQAHRGIIFLDEIGDMKQETQAKLLRVLQERSFYRLGGRDLVKVDVRVITATRRDLERAVAEGEFREDLYHRLNDAVIRLPALRERREDIEDLVLYFLRSCGAELGSPNAAIAQEALEHLKGLPWPGNVRQLRNLCRRALLLSRGQPITLEIAKEALERTDTILSDTTSFIARAGAAFRNTPAPGETSLIPRVPAVPEGAPGEQNCIARFVAELLKRAQRGDLHGVKDTLMGDVERELYKQAIELSKGNQSLAARWLGVSHPTMASKLREYGLHPGRSEG